MKCSRWLAFVILGSLVPVAAFGGDWPQFRYDAGRTAASPEQLPDELHLEWSREFPTPRPAFPGEVRLRYDVSYEPVVLGTTMFVPSMVTDSVTALDTETGTERWRFFTEGPVRFAPVAWQDRVYFASDDGHLYCLNAADGTLRWKFRGLPSDREDRKLLGNQRLITLWPARGGPVLADGRIYFAAGLWPAEGVFVHALDAQSGQVVWSNTDSHMIPEANMDHGIAQYAGLTPQGYLAIVGGRLVVPCGAQLPAFLDLKTGKLDTYCMGWGGRNGLPKGSWFVAGVGDLLSHSGDLYDLSQRNQERFSKPYGNRDFKSLLYPGGFQRFEIDPTNQKALGEFGIPVLTPETLFVNDKGIVAYDVASGKREERSKSEIPAPRKNDKYPDRWRMRFSEAWKFPSKHRVHIKAGRDLYVGGPGRVEALRIPGQAAKPEAVRQNDIPGTPHRMLAAAGKLFVVTREGGLYAFGPRAKADAVVHRKPQARDASTDQWTTAAAEILELTGTTDGYAVVLGIGTGRLAEELIRQSKVYVIGVDDDIDKVAAVRDRLHSAGLYGTRASIHVGDPLSYAFPPYLASLVVSEREKTDGLSVDRDLVAGGIRLLRPYGGSVCVALPTEQRSALKQIVADVSGTHASVRQSGDWTVVTVDGKLPGSADWSHPVADAANSGASEDGFLKAPLGLLWFDGALRWHRKPGSAEVRVAGGRILVKAQKLVALDVYTGRTLWEAALPFSLKPTDQLVAFGDAIYATGGKSCVVLDPATGEISNRFELPADLPGPWTNLRVAGDCLVGQSGKYLLCVDRTSGRLNWKYECSRTSLNIAVGGAKVFCAELVNKRKGETEGETTKTRAFDLKTGDVVWEIVGGSGVKYSEPHDLLVTTRGIYQGKDGKLAVKTAGFDQKHGNTPCGPLSIAGDKLLWGTVTSFAVYQLKSGAPLAKSMVWVRRGCTDLRASSNLVTTRNRGNCAYIDLASQEMTSLWSTRPACNNNLFPANGVLNIPCLTGGCECNYTPASQAYVPTAMIERGRQGAVVSGHDS